MANPYFEFKQFTVFHDRCAMKVGTDGVLLGAWVRLDEARRVLDIGTGTGLIALMVAQRAPEARIVAVELDTDACGQAKENVERSPWNGRIETVNTDIKRFEWEGEFDVIVSNPPYFSKAMGCPTEGRQLARHDTGLTFGELLGCVERLLAAQGEFSVVIPSDAAPEMIGIAAQHRLYLTRKLWVKTTPKAAPKRCLLAFRKVLPQGRFEEKTLVVQTGPMEYTDEYKALTGEFYLR